MTFTLPRWLFLAVSLLATIALPATGQPTATSNPARDEVGAMIDGRVIGRDGQPVAGVTVYCISAPDAAHRERKTTRTDEDGWFFCYDLRPGVAYTVRVEEPILRPTQLEDVVAPNPKPIRLVLRPRATLRGRVLDPSGRPVEGIIVSAVDNNSSTIPIWVNGFAHNRSDESGFFELRGVPPKKARLMASTSGWLLADEPVIDVPADAVIDGIELRLKRGGTVVGNVLDSQGRPVPEALVEVTPRITMPEDPPATHSDEQGRFSVSGLRAGRYSVRAEHPDFGRTREQVELSEDGQAGVELRLSETSGSEPAPADESRQPSFF